MKRTLAALITAGLLSAVPAQAASTPLTIAKRAALAKAKAVTHSSTAQIKDARLVGPGKRYDIGVKAGACNVFMRVTVVRGKAKPVVVTGKDCSAPSTNGN